jgi:aquaporin Z
MNGTTKKYVAELIGTAVLVLMGCGSVVLGYGGAFPLGMLPVAFAFGLSLAAMVYVIGPISGCHINPAVTAAMYTAGRIEAQEAIGYIVSQVVGAIVGALILVIIVKGRVAGYDLGASGLAQNGWGAGYGGEYGTLSAIVAELAGSFIFTATVVGVTQAKTMNGMVAGLVIGLALTLIHIVFIPVTGVSVNPARSIGPAIFVGGTALVQLWLFIIVPLVGGAIAGWTFRAKVLSAD